MRVVMKGRDRKGEGERQRIGEREGEGERQREGEERGRGKEGEIVNVKGEDLSVLLEVQRWVKPLSMREKISNMGCTLLISRINLCVYLDRRNRTLNSVVYFPSPRLPLRPHTSSDTNVCHRFKKIKRCWLASI